MSLDERIKKIDILTRDLVAEVKHDYNKKLWDVITEIFDNLDSYVGVIDYNTKELIYMNPAAIQHDIDVGTNARGQIGKDCKEACKQMNLPFDCENCPMKEVFKTNKISSSTFISSFTGIEYNFICIPIRFNGTQSVIAIMSESKDE